MTMEELEANTKKYKTQEIVEGTPLEIIQYKLATGQSLTREEQLIVDQVNTTFKNTAIAFCAFLRTLGPAIEKVVRKHPELFEDLLDINDDVENDAELQD